MASRPPFHLAFGVRDLDEARRFYCDLLACAEGRSAERWVDLDFFGHQLSLHLTQGEGSDGAGATNPVDGDDVPLPHFGVVLDIERWRELSEQLTAAGTDFVIEPRTRFAGQAGEQATLFVRDPSGNALEFKAFENLGDLFASDGPR